MSKYIYDPPYNQKYGVKYFPDNKYKIQLCGDVDSYDNLPTNNVSTGDAYFINENSSLMVWVVNDWYPLSDPRAIATLTDRIAAISENSTGTGIEPYQLVYSGNTEINTNQLTIPLYSDEDHIGGYSDVVITCDLMSTVAVTAHYSKYGNSSLTSVTLQHPNPSSEYMGLGVARFWNDGGLFKMSYGCGYNANLTAIPQTEGYIFNIDGAFPISQFIATLTISVNGSFGYTYPVKVYARYSVAEEAH